MESQDLACGAARPLLRREEKGVLGPEGGSAVCSLAVVEDLARAAGRRVGRPRGEAACGGAAGVSPLTDPRSDWGSGRECANGEGPWRETAGGTPSACSCVGDGRPQLPWAGREAPWGEPGFLGGWPGRSAAGEPQGRQGLPGWRGGHREQGQPSLRAPCLPGVGVVWGEGAVEEGCRLTGASCRVSVPVMRRGSSWRLGAGGQGDAPARRLHCFPVRPAAGASLPGRPLGRLSR